MFRDASVPLSVESDAPEVSDERVVLDTKLQAWLKEGTKRAADAKPRVAAVSGDAGLGKTYTGIARADYLILATAHWRLAKQNHETALTLQKTSFWWCGFQSGFRPAVEKHGWQGALGHEKRKKLADELGQIQRDGRPFMCVYGDLTAGMQARGWQVGTSFCPSCPFQKPCRARGHQSQVKKAQEARQIHVSFPELLFDGALATFLRNLAPGNTAAARQHALAKYVGMLDDIPLSSLVVRRQVSVVDLDILIKERREDCVAAETDDTRTFKAYPETEKNLITLLQEIRETLINAKTTTDLKRGLKAVVDTYSEAQLQTGCRQLARIPFYFKKQTARAVLDTKTERQFQVGDEESIRGLPEWLTVGKTKGKHYRHFLTPQTALGLQVRGEMGTEDILFSAVLDKGNLPRVVDEEHGWLAGLLNPDSGIRRLETPKGPALEVLLNPNVNLSSLLFLSATTAPEHVKTIFGDAVDFSIISNKTPAWQPGSRVTQVKNARYTNASFVVKKDGKVVKPGPRARDVVSLIWKEIHAGKSVVLVGRRFWEEEAVLSDLLKPLKDKDFRFENYGKVVGRNDFQNIDTLIITLPTPNREQLEQVASARYRVDFETLDFETRVDGQIRGGAFYLEGDVFSDTRVQKIAEEIISHEIYQTAMRVRPSENPDKAIVLFTNFPTAGLTDRPDTVLCSLPELMAAVEVRAVESIASLWAAGVSVEEITKRLGVSERAVYDDATVQAAVAADRDAKTERDAAIRARADAGESQRALAKAFNVSRAQVQRISNKN